MADRTLRRARPKAGKPVVFGATDEQPGDVAGTVNGDTVASGAEPDTNGASELDTTEVDGAARIGVVEVDPADIDQFIASGGHRTEPEPDASKPRQRRQRSDTGTTRRRRSGKEAPQDLAPLLNMVHTWAPIMLQIPELAVPPDELKQLTDAYAEFSKHHAVPEVTEKRISEANLIIALCMVYGTRFVAFAKRKSNERKAAPQQQQSNVVPMQQPRQNVM